MLVEKDRDRLNRFHNDALDPYEITVYLGKGVHHLYTCNISDGAETCDNVYCHKDIQRFYQLVDNIIFHFKPLRPDSLTTVELQALYTDVGATYNGATSKLAMDNLAVPTDSKPTIAMMDNEANFNITRGASFEDIIFRGDYGMMKVEDADLVKSPRKFCEVDETSDLLSYGALTLKKTQPPNYSGSYDCEQIYFQAAVVDTQTTDEARTCTFESKIGSVRGCSGEPYHADYNATFGGGRVRYKRRKVLFNLYNFDLDSSRYDATKSRKPIVKLEITNCEFKYFLKDYEALIYAETSIVERKSTQFA